MTTDTPPSFAALGLAAAVLQAVTDVGYETPSTIQAESIPPLLAGRDLLGQAQTGTGKTAAFALPLLSRLDPTRRELQLLVLTPTRELAIQVAEALQTYARHLPGFHVLPIYGGQGMEPQLRGLRRGAHAVVATPGRLLDHLGRGTLKLDTLTAVVLDEADEMLRMGFIDDVGKILDACPEKRQVALFSATMPEPVRRIARRHLHDPVEIRSAERTATVASVTQRYWRVSGTHKLDALTRILEVEEFDAMLVFVRTKTMTTELAERLEARGHACAALNGDLPQALREKTVERLRDGRIDILVATDVAARGLDVERITHVVNYDIPYDTEAYVHRIGRTGRAGRIGHAILFVASRERHLLQAIERATRQPIDKMELPSAAEIADRRVGRFKQALETVLATEELDFFRELVTGYREEHDLDPDAVAAALAFMVQRDQPLTPGASDERGGEPVRDSAAGPREAAPAARPTRSTDERPERAPRQKPPPGEMVVYRVAVGREHGIEARHLVGAIANEAGLDSQHIGAIRFHERHSTVELPPGMPKEILRHLQKVQVCGKPLMIAPERARPERDAAPAAERKPRKRLTLDGQRAPDKPKRVFTKRPAKR